ncbi:MAG: single-stranded DNA-binding protein [Marmoricola sp.]
MNDTLVTLAGYLGSEVVVRDAGGGVPVAGFRVATTPRRFSRKDDAWVDGDTQWYSVSAWRQLAENCALSLRRGDPVVVHGRLSAETWQNKAGIEVSSMAIELIWIGHDLTRGTSSFAKTARAPEESVGASSEAPAA